MKTEYLAEIKHSALPQKIQELIANDIVGNDGRWVKITLQFMDGSRSNSQNAYYWGTVIPLMQQEMKSLGNSFSKQYVHRLMKKKFLSIDIEDEEESTTKLSTQEFTEYLSHIKQWAAEFLSLNIPDPK
jgi:hypothetical protein